MRKINSYKNYFSPTYLIIIGVILILILMGKRIFSFFAHLFSGDLFNSGKTSKEAIDQAKKDVDKNNLTHPLSWYSQKSQELYTYMKDTGTESNSILEIINNINNYNDYLQLFIDFGTPDYGYFGSAFFWGTPSDLNQWLKYELSASDYNSIKNKIEY